MYIVVSCFHHQSCLLHFFIHVYRKNKSPVQKMAMPYGNLPDILYVQKEICNGIRKMLFKKRLALEYGVFRKMYALYIEEKQINRRSKKWLCHTEISRKYCLSQDFGPLFVQRRPSTKLYNNEFATESDKLCLNGWLWRMLLFMHFIYRKYKSPVQIWPCNAEISRTYCLGLGFGPIMCKEDPLKLYKYEFATESDKWCLRVCSRIWCFYALYIHKEQIAGPKNYNATRKSPGHIVWVKALSLILCKEHPLKLYKSNLQRNQTKF
jgi:hypothetical protein